jgi:hypothetical protein
MTRGEILLELAGLLLVVAGIALALMTLLELADPPPSARPLLVQSDWRRCVVEPGPPLPLQKAYHRNPNGGIA